MSRRGVVYPIVGVAAAVLVVIGVLVAVAPSATYPVRAVFASADGLFPGNSVQMLGVTVGTVSAVRNVGDTVVVTMSVADDQAVPAGARAALVSPELLGEPSIELSPGYSGGQRMTPGTTIPESRTSVPVSTDQLLKDLQSFRGRIDPTSTGDLVTDLAQDLAGQGPALNQLLGNAAGTLQLLAQKGDDLGQLDGTLAQITGTLGSKTATITQLIQDYDTVSGVVADHQVQLGQSVTDLADASLQLSQFLTPDVQPLESDVNGITQVGRTLSRNLGSIDQLLSSAVLLFAAAQRAYDPSANWLNLNNQTAPGVTASVVTGLIRDRLAGVCRRIAANHAAGLSAGELATLQTCGNPSSGYFDPILGLVPSTLAALTDGPGGGPSPAALQALVAQGLASIPAAPALTAPSATTPAPTPTPTPAPAAPATSVPVAPSLTTPGAQTLPALPAVPDDARANSGGGLLGNLLGGL